MQTEAKLISEMREFEDGMDFVNVNIKDLRKTFPNKFVAVQGKDIVVYASSMDELMTKAEAKKIDLAMLFIEFIPSKEVMFIL